MHLNDIIISNNTDIIIIIYSAKSLSISNRALKNYLYVQIDSIRKTRSEQVEVMYTLTQNTVIHRIENGCTKQNWMTIVLDARLLNTATSIQHSCCF